MTQNRFREALQTALTDDGSVIDALRTQLPDLIAAELVDLERERLRQERRPLDDVRDIVATAGPEGMSMAEFTRIMRGDLGLSQSGAKRRMIEAHERGLIAAKDPTAARRRWIAA
ncbi:hypothetical protein GCM10007304_14720 [Rhodococcoides trifolii]|uniref:Uncharacterized protein n=1 Tax=Rhodococcoides trifolii TaxID=908250 RepID=A0A917CY67_9NOCA|nr:hypothetical protein [Rhodococcus trifolii]GGG01758.1 hypothetical protein GCM10007304_14720 [Rhodococcus trifolii]